MGEKDQIRFERISAFLTNKMQAEERAVFEDETRTDKALQEELGVQTELQLAIELGGIEDTLHQIHAKNFDSQSSKKSNWFSIAASIAAVIAFGIWFANQSGPRETLFAEYATYEPGLPVPMSSTSQYRFYDAMVDYKSEKYSLAMEKWKGILIEKPQNDTLNYFIGSALFNLEKYEESLPYFATTEQDLKSGFKNKAQWYSVLIHLQLANDAAIKNLTPYTDSEFATKIIAIQKNL